MGLRIPGSAPYRNLTGSVTLSRFQVMPTMEYMRASIEDAKAMTKSLRESLVARNVSLGR
jgi:hypothetical protein